MNLPDDQLRQRVTGLLHKRPVSWRRATGGYTPAERWVVTFEDRTSCFVKAGTNPMTADWLRAEYQRVYSRLDASFMAKLLGWEDDESKPMLVLEDLSHAHWPPPRRPGQVGGVVSTLAAVSRTKLSGLPRLEENKDCRDWWPQIEGEPDAFLGLGLASAEWLQAALPALSAASGAAPFEGEELVHFDVRSDNICFVDDRVVLIDWNGACIGNGAVNLAIWLSSLHAEGGPPPESILPHEPELAAWISGYFAYHAGLPKIPNAPRVREVQLFQLLTALPWATRALGLPPLDGPNAP